MTHSDLHFKTYRWHSADCNGHFLYECLHESETMSHTIAAHYRTSESKLWHRSWHPMQSVSRRSGRVNGAKAWVHLPIDIFSQWGPTEQTTPIPTARGGKRERLEREWRGRGSREGGRKHREKVLLPVFCFLSSFPPQWGSRGGIPARFHPWPASSVWLNYSHFLSMESCKAAGPLTAQEEWAGLGEAGLGTDWRNRSLKKGLSTGLHQSWTRGKASPTPSLPPSLSLSFRFLRTTPCERPSSSSSWMKPCKRINICLALSHAHVHTHTLCLTRVALQIHSQRLDGWLEEMSETFHFRVSPQTSAEFTRHSELFVYWMVGIWTGLIS